MKFFVFGLEFMYTNVKLSRTIPAQLEDAGLKI